MEMKNPVHPGELVKACLDELGLSVAEAAKGLGITASSFTTSLPDAAASRRKWRSALKRHSAARQIRGFGCR